MRAETAAEREKPVIHREAGEKVKKLPLQYGELAQKEGPVQNADVTAHL